MVNVNTLSCQSRQEVIKLNLVKKGTLPGTRTGMAVSVFRKHSTLSKRESSVWRLTLNINTSDTGPHLTPHLLARLLLRVKLMLPAQGRGVHWRRGRRNHLRQEKTVKIGSSTQ